MVSTQPGEDDANQWPGNDDLQWRSNLLKSVAELFEREQRSLLSELQTSILEAQSECDAAGGDVTAAAKLEALERKVRAQVLCMPHQHHDVIIL